MKRTKMERIIVLLLVVVLLCTSADVTTVRAANSGTETMEEYVESVSAGDYLESEKCFEHNGLRYTFSVTSQWEDAYNANIKIENQTEYDIDDWCISMPWEQEITSIWNAQIVDYADGIYHIKNVNWNQDIKSGESIEFGVTIAGKFSGCPEYYEMNGKRNQTNAENYEVVYSVTAKWDNGFNGLITVFNKTDTIIEDWQLAFDFENEISDIWNGSILSHEGTHYVIKCLEYNQNIYPDESISIGFTSIGGNADKFVSNVRLDEMGKSGYDNNSGITDTENNVVLAIEEDYLSYNDNIDMYVVNEKLDVISGTLAKTDVIQELSYVITDINDVIVDEGIINIEENWTIDAPGLVIGCNFLKVTAVGKNSEEYTAELELLNMQEENMADANVDTKDTDEDGICNYYESIVGTSQDTDDTDDDGLSDLLEFVVLGTDPCNVDSDYNGVNDGDEDFDADGLSNQEEVIKESSIYLTDTDDDGITDYDEINKYGTKPAIYDTDEDGMSDGRECELLLNPLETDSDGDGVSDGEEVINQTYTFLVENEDKKAIEAVSVNLDCAGDINSNLYIMDLYNLDMRSTEVVGLIGVPVDISCCQEFDIATITFSYDEDALNTTEDNLGIMWYDEANDKYILVEDAVIDTESNTISYVTNHFSTWLVVDKEQWINCWETTVSAQEGVSSGGYPSLTVEFEDGIHRYQLFEHHGSWADAEEICEHAGGYLATIQSDYENTVVYNYVREQECESAYIGLSDAESEGKWEWSNGEPVEYTNWHKGEPNGNRRENYAMYYFKYKDGSWNDGSFNAGNTERDVSIFVCEWKDIDIETDTDKDGLPDYCERSGFQMSNGEIICTDPFLDDTDGDEILDYDEVGGMPVMEEYVIDGKVYRVLVSHPLSYGELPDRFIYVDGRTNKNGEVYKGGIGYVPYLEAYYQGKYVDAEYFELFGESKRLVPTQVHNICVERWTSMPSEMQNEFLSWYALVDTILYSAMVVSPASQDIFDIYVSGVGAENRGMGKVITRHYFDCDYILFGEDRIGSNAAYVSIMENMPQVIIAANSVLSKENNEICISINPEQTWNAFSYVNFDDNTWKGQNIYEVLRIAPSNLSGFGIFNTAIPAVTAYCTYDYETEEYHMEYVYYILDYYDFPGLPFLAEQDAVGLAQSFELYGKCYGEYSWKKGDLASAFKFYN